MTSRHFKSLWRRGKDIYLVISKKVGFAGLLGGCFHHEAHEGHEGSDNLNTELRALRVLRGEQNKLNVTHCPHKCL